MTINITCYTLREEEKGREGGRERKRGEEQERERRGMGRLVHPLVCLENLRSEKQHYLFQILQYTHDLSHVPTDGIHNVFNNYCTVNAVR